MTGILWFAIGAGIAWLACTAFVAVLIWRAPLHDDFPLA